MSIAWATSLGVPTPLDSFLTLHEAEAFIVREENMKGGDYVIDQGLDGKFHVYCYGAHPGALEGK